MPTTPIHPISSASAAMAVAQHQTLRLRRFGMASSTYALGLLILALCTFLGLLPIGGLKTVAVCFAVINLGLLLAFLSGWNERFSDPSLTGLQTVLGVSMVAVILVQGPELQFVAAPFYSVIFIFGMLRMQARDLTLLAIYVLASYSAATLLRHQLYPEAMDMRRDAVISVLVVGSSIWFAAAASYISRLRARLRASLQHIAALATHDALTGIWNRRQIDQDLEAAIKHAHRSGSPLSILLVDVDHFKSVNDRHGHATGDEVLKAVANCLAAALRAGDQVARYGGEEFLLLLPGTSLAQASVLAERLRLALLALRVLPQGDGPLSASFGLAVWRAGESAEQLVRRADQAMYRAKAAGRNRVEADSLFQAMG
jgi:diguanylate cyclase (GGDEF)-like protein